MPIASGHRTVLKYIELYSNLPCGAIVAVHTPSTQLDARQATMGDSNGGGNLAYVTNGLLTQVQQQICRRRQGLAEEDLPYPEHQMQGPLRHHEGEPQA